LFGSPEVLGPHERAFFVHPSTREIGGDADTRPDHQTQRHEEQRATVYPFCALFKLSTFHDLARVGGKAKSLGHRLFVDRHTVPEAPFGPPIPLIRLRLEVGTFFI